LIKIKGKVCAQKIFFAAGRLKAKPNKTVNFIVQIRPDQLLFNAKALSIRYLAGLLTYPQIIAFPFRYLVQWHY